MSPALMMSHSGWTQTQKGIFPLRGMAMGSSLKRLRLQSQQWLHTLGKVSKQLCPCVDEATIGGTGSSKPYILWGLSGGRPQT